MIPFGKVAAVLAVFIVVLSGLAMLTELELVSYTSPGGARGWRPSHEFTRGDYGTDIMINPGARLPNERSRKDGTFDIASDVGTRSIHNGDHQRRRQLWLEERADFLRAEGSVPEDERGERRLAEAATVPVGGGGTRGAEVKAMAGSGLEGGKAPLKQESRRSPQGQRGGGGGARGEGRKRGGGRGAGAGGVLLDERLHRLEKGVDLWGATYVPPIAPEEWQRLADKWTGTGGNGTEVGAPRILFVVTSFDRGGRLGNALKGVVDKLDYMLMIMDEIREACEAGFTMKAHIISAWNARREEQVFHDRLFCRRTGQTVPISFEEHPPAIQEVLSIKHRLYMKPRLEQYDLFIQAEDDMIFTVNHILLYLEESEKLSRRRQTEVASAVPAYDFMPGFIRVEPDSATQGVGGEWYQWEIILSRIRGKQIKGAGTYLSLEKSRVLASNGNNQGMWVATRGQLQYLARKCQYLRYTDKSSLGFVEKFSGSIEMFSWECQTTKVFPAARFEDFLVHHRTNNKKGKRGESLPPVSVSIMRFWASQILRDSGMLREAARRRLAG